MSGESVRWWQLPSFPDEDEARRARLLHTIAIFATLSVIPFMVAAIFTAPSLALAFVVYGTVAVFHLGILGLVKRRRVRLAGILHIVGYWTIATAVTTFVGGVGAMHAALFVTLTLLAGLGTGVRAGLITAAVSGLTVIVLAVIEHKGWLPQSAIPLGLAEHVTSLLANVFFAGFFVFVSMRAVDEALSQARAAQALERERAEQAEILARIGHEAVTSESSAQLATRVLDAIAQHLRAERMAVLKRDPGAAPLAVRGSAVQHLADFHLDTNTLAALPPEGGPLETACPLSDAVGTEGWITPIPGRPGHVGALIVCGRVAPGARRFLATAAGMLGAAIERDDTRTQLWQAQKMEVVGRVAGGVAHDFNNLLTSITGCTALLLESLPADSDDAQLARDASNAAERAALLTQKLLAFSRKQPLHPEVLDLNDVVRAFGPVVQRLLRADVAIDLELEERPAQVLMDRTGLDQVLLNLAVNARDAMPEGGRLRLQTRVAAGGIELTVGDTGSGMDERTRERLFEPFFTTKTDGTGLGLTTVASIVQRSGGRIDVDTAPGRGTRFTVHLPHAQGMRAAVVDAVRKNGTGLILLVDDDDGARRATARMLESVGYRVIAAASPGEALALFDKTRGIDLVVSDVIMPDGGGRRIGRELGGRVPILFISGYDDGADDLGGSLLPKPFTPAVLSARVHALLHPTSQPTPT